MLIIGLVIVAAGLALIANLFGAADLLASLARPFPWFMRAPYSDSPAYYRIVGVGFVAVGFLVAVTGARG